MSIRCVVSSTLVMLVISPLQAVTVQSPDDLLADGSAYLWLEAEDVFQLNDADPADAEVGFILVDNENPIQTIELTPDDIEVVAGGLDVLPEDTNASGGAGLFAQLGGGGTAKWQLQFALPATYHLYMHWSVYNRDANSNYGNEDSFYVPPSFNANSRSDWIDFEGVDTFGEPKTGDSDRDGYIDGFPTMMQNWVSEGAVEAHNSTDEEFYEGQYHWYRIEKANDMNADNAFVSFDGHAIQYDVSDADVGQVLDFEISYREPYGTFDGFLFSTSPTLLDDFTQEQMDEFFLNLGGATTPGDFDGDGDVDAADIDSISAAINAGNMDSIYDMDGSGVVDADDRSYLIGTTLNTYLGDSNLDGEFNSSDFVAVFTIGEYEDEIAGNSGWADGDWNGDTDFDSSDFVVAFSEAAYETGPKPVAAAQVPEPAMSGLLATMLLATLLRLRTTKI